MIFQNWSFYSFLNLPVTVKWTGRDWRLETEIADCILSKHYNHGLTVETEDMTMFDGDDDCFVFCYSMVWYGTP